MCLGLFDTKTCNLKPPGVLQCVEAAESWVFRFKAWDCHIGLTDGRQSWARVLFQAFLFICSVVHEQA